MKSWLLTGLVAAFAALGNAQEPISREMRDRQWKTIRDTPPGEPVILRLDSQLEELLHRAGQLPEAERVPFVAAGLSPQRKLYAIFGMPQLHEFARYLLGKASYPKVNLYREAFTKRDLSAEIRDAYQRCVKAYGKPLPKAPLYKVAFGYQRTTNAQSQGIDQNLGRAIVVLNRSALAVDRRWDAAVIHETWHCFQAHTAARKSLLEHALHEGVVTYLTQVVDPTLDDRAVLLWSRAEWQAAQQRRDQIVQAFATDHDLTDDDVIKQYMVLGKPLVRVPGTPSRCGYFVGLLAVRAWQRAHPDLGPADLIATRAADVWKDFPLETKR